MKLIYKNFILLILLLISLFLLVVCDKNKIKMGNIGNISKENAILLNEFVNTNLDEKIQQNKQKINSYFSFNEMMNDLDNGNINYAIVDSISAKYYNNNNKNINIDTKNNNFIVKFCLGFRKNQEDLCKDSSIVIKQLKDDGYINMFYTNFIEGIMNGSKPIAFNTNIKEEYKKCKVGFTGDFIPFDYVDENNNPSGFTTAFFVEMGKKLLLNFEFVKYDYKDIFKALQDGEIDCIYGIRNFNDIWKDVENDMLVSESIIETPLSIVSKIIENEG